MEFRNQQLLSVLDGKVNSWIPDLMPEIDEYLSVYQNALLSIITFYADFALRNNRSIWGMKLPEWNPANLLQLHQILPESKAIFLHRDLEDCVKSAKKSDMVRGAVELERFCRVWKQHTDFANTNLNDEWVLHLKYEDVVTRGDESIDRIEAFTGSVRIDKKVLNVKINTYKDDPQLAINAEPYLEPMELSKTELEIVRSFV